MAEVPLPQSAHGQATEKREMRYDAGVPLQETSVDANAYVHGFDELDGSEEPTIESPTTILETVVIPEKPRYGLRKTAAFAGPAGVGKDAVVNLLKERHGWHVEDGSSYGFKRRRDSSEMGKLGHTQAEHREFDGAQAQYFRQLTAESPKSILQTRLSGIILAEERDKRAVEIIKNRIKRQKTDDIAKIESIPAVSILLTATKPTRVARLFPQAHDAWMNQQERLGRGESLREDEKLIEKEPTLASVERDMDAKEREVTDLEWAPIHKEYVKVGGNPFNPALERTNRDRIYDIVIPTDGLTIEEVADLVERRLLSRGVIFAIDEDPDPEPNEPEQEPSIMPTEAEMGEPIPMRTQPRTFDSSIYT
jgi:hypothetical protein